MERVSEPSSSRVRPPHVTVASGTVIVGSLFVVAQMWDRIAGLHSLNTRTTLASYLAGSRLADAGVDLAQLTEIVRITAMAAAGCATATLILGWQVTRRSKGARLALSVLAGALVLTGLVSDWFVESVAGTFWACGVGAAVVTLWLGPARLWFSDTPMPVLQKREHQLFPGSPPPAPPPAPPPPRYDVPTRPPADQQPPPMQHPWPPTAWTPPPVSAYDAPRRPQAPARRPPALLWACIVTWCCTGFAAVVLVVSILTLAGNSQPVLDDAFRQNPQLSDQGFSHHDLLVMLYVVIALVLVGSAAAATFAALLYRGRRWAYYALLASASLASVFFLVSALGSLIGLLPLAASVGTIVLLVRPEVRAWVVRR
jgi:hypothetical protein